MKKFLLLMTAIVVMTSLVLSATVMAADDSYFKFKKTELNYAETDSTIQIDVIAAQDFTTPAYNIRVEYDAELWAISSITSGGGKSEAGGKNIVSITTGTFDAEDMVEVSEGDTLLKFKIKALKNDASFGTSTFKFAMAEILTTDMNGYAYQMTDMGEVVVTDTRVFETKTPAAIVAGTPAYQTFTGATGQVYNNVWVNKFTATANDDVITSVLLAFNNKSVTVSNVEIEGTVEFDIAIVGATLDATVTPSVTVK